MISVICAFNDGTILDRMLLTSLNGQDTGHEFIGIDNTDGRHTCAATVLNETAPNATNDLLMFVHQDVELLSPTWLSDAERLMAALPRRATAGVAGRDDDGRTASSVWHGAARTFAGGSPVDTPTKVQTLDGCLLLAWRDDVLSTRFDPLVCTGWYLYVAEYCLSRRRFGFPTYVLPLPVYHLSTGPGATAWRPTADAIAAKHRRTTPRINLTVGNLARRRPLWRRVAGRTRRVIDRFV